MKPDYARAIRAIEADYELGRAIARKSAVSKGDLKKYEKLSGKDILPTETHQEISKQLFQYTPLSAKFDEQKKAIEAHGEKMVMAIENRTGLDNQLVRIIAGEKLRRGPNIDDVDSGCLKEFVLGYARDQNTRISRYPFKRFKMKRFTEANPVVDQKVDLEKFTEELFDQPMKSNDLYWKTHNDLVEQGDLVANSAKLKQKAKKDKKIKREMEDFLSTNTWLKDEIHGIYSTFKRVSERSGVPIQPGDMRTRAESSRSEPSGSKPDLDSDAIAYINAKISMDEDLQKIDREDLIGLVKEAHKQVGETSLGTAQIDAVLDKAKERAKEMHRPPYKILELTDLPKELDKMQSEKKPETKKKRKKQSLESLPTSPETRKKLLERKREREEEEKAKEREEEVKSNILAQRPRTRSREFYDDELETSGRGLKILQPNQMMTRLPVLMAQVRAGNNSKSLLNELKQMAYSLLRSKHITKLAYNRILNFVKNI